MQTVVRIYDIVTGSHIYTQSEAEASQLIEDGDRYRDEGAVFESVGPNPVVRFRNLVTGGIFYSISPEEQATVRQNPGFSEVENGGFNATINPRLGVDPVYRFYNTVTGRHFFTSNPTEAASVRANLPALRDEGIGFYADPLGEPPFPAAIPIQPNSNPSASITRPLRPGNPPSNFSDAALASGGLNVIPSTAGTNSNTASSSTSSTTTSTTGSTTSSIATPVNSNITTGSTTTGGTTTGSTTSSGGSSSSGGSIGTAIADNGASSGNSSSSSGSSSSGSSSSSGGSSSGGSSSGSGSSSSSGGSGSSSSGGSSSSSGGSSSGGGSSDNSGSSSGGSSSGGSSSDNSGGSSGGPTPDAGSVGYGAFEQQVLSLVNDARSAQGLSPLSHDPLLGQVAEAHSADMLARDFFAHTNPSNETAGDRIRAAGFSGRTGENIAAAFSTPSGVVTGWLNSSGHRANILSPNFTKIGLGHVFSSNDPGNVTARHYWTQAFNG
ncbi:MAG: CAP domain-containing protein [Cyanobacteria bacterium P01_D01_bin.73]